MEQIKSVLFVCIGNHCRSPVAQHLLMSLNNNINVSSAGISPLFSNDMHPLSREFLDSKNINHAVHHPRKFDVSDFDKFNYIIVLDDIIGAQLLRKYSQHSSKIFKINHFTPSIYTPDPFKLSEIKYNQIMCNIDTLVSNWNNFLVGK